MEILIRTLDFCCANGWLEYRRDLNSRIFSSYPGIPSDNFFVDHAEAQVYPIRRACCRIQTPHSGSYMFITLSIIHLYGHAHEWIEALFQS